jgi:hypothetical protein
MTEDIENISQVLRAFIQEAINQSTQASDNLANIEHVEAYQELVQSLQTIILNERKSGIAEGRIIGVIESKIEIAFKLLEMDQYDIKTISIITELEPEVIMELIKQKETAKTS